MSSSGSPGVTVVRGIDYYTIKLVTAANSKFLTTANKVLPAATFYSLGTSWNFNSAWKMTGRYGGSQQASNGLLPMPGVFLADDQQEKWELGIEGSVSRGFNPAINYFHRDVKNEKAVAGYIMTLGGTTCTALPAAGLAAGATPYTPCYNQSNTTRDGIELSANGVFAERSNYRTSLTTFTRLSTNAASITPRNIIDLSFAHGMGAFTFTGSLKNVSSYKGAVADLVPYLGNYTRYDLGFGYDTKFGNMPLKTTFYGKNLSNVKYETTNGIQDIGRVIGVEAVASF